MCQKIFLLLILLSATAQAFNLRKSEQMLFSSLQECNQPCWNIADQVLQGETIGFNSVNDGDHFSSPFLLRGVNQCCSQNLTYSGFNIPDNANITTLNIPDYMVIQVNISQAVKDENQTYNNQVMINHQFERQALNISIPPQYLSANLTYSEEFDLNLNQCEDIDFDWMGEYSLVGKSVFTSQILGAYQIITVSMYTNQTYTESQVEKIYWNYIQKNDLSSIEKAFPNADVYSIGTNVNGGKSLFDFQNWPSYIKSLNISNYGFTRKSFSQTVPKFSSMDSYKLFDGMSSSFQECALQQWNIKFNNTSAMYSY